MVILNWPNDEWGDWASTCKELQENNKKSSQSTSSKNKKHELIKWDHHLRTTNYPQKLGPKKNTGKIIGSPRMVFFWGCLAWANHDAFATWIRLSGISGWKNQFRVDFENPLGKSGIKLTESTDATIRNHWYLEMAHKSLIARLTEKNCLWRGGNSFFCFGLSLVQMCIR